MKIQVADKNFEERNILPGTERTWEFKPNHEDSFSVKGSFTAGTPIQADSIGYTDHKDTREHHFTIKENGRVAYSSPK
ncbi:MAG: hypothetical protein IGS39_24370 [Calothrix sp. C42_A2020_038]|nr:hypothetical protein [Calothrix sp. C42_A2020_038]